MVLVYVLRLGYSRGGSTALTHAAAPVSRSLTFLTVQARVSGRAHTLAPHAAPPAVALVVPLANLPHHLTVLSCRGQRSEVRRQTQAGERRGGNGILYGANRGLYGANRGLYGANRGVWFL